MGKKVKVRGHWRKDRRSGKIVWVKEHEREVEGGEKRSSVKLHDTGRRGRGRGVVMGSIKREGDFRGVLRELEIETDGSEAAEELKGVMLEVTPIVIENALSGKWASVFARGNAERMIYNTARSVLAIRKGGKEITARYPSEDVLGKEVKEGDRVLWLRGVGILKIEGEA